MELNELLVLKKELLKANESKDAELALDMLRKLIKLTVRGTMLCFAHIVTVHARASRR